MNLWIHRRLSKLRPSDGESVRTCGHPNPAHYFFNAADPMNRLRWLALCRECFANHGHEPEVAVAVETEAA
jgi:hypothetical protein